MPKTPPEIAAIRAGFKALKATEPMFRERAWSAFRNADRNPFADDIKAANEAMWAAENQIVAACRAAQAAGVSDAAIYRALTRGMVGVTHCSRILKNEVELYGNLAR